MNKRLRMIKAMIKPCRMLADIGTDHAWLTIELVKDGIAERACACDIAPGPLSAAEKHIREAGLENRIQTILSDGFEHVPHKADAAVLAGMGFHTAQQILLDAGDLSNLKQIIVQVNNDTETFRRWISEMHWTIVGEDICEDRGFYYQAVSIRPVKHAAYSEEELILGPVLKQQNTEIFQDWRRHEAQLAETVMKKRNREDLRQKDLRHHLEIYKGR